MFFPSKYFERILPVFIFLVSLQVLAVPSVLYEHYFTKKGTDIHVIFDEELNPATLNGTNITVVGSTSGPVSADLSNYDAVSGELPINPDADFVPGEDVVVTLTTGVQNTIGEGLAGDYVISFTVQDPLPAPASGKYVFWAGAVSGNWNTAANWNPARVPGADDVAWINKTGTPYTVTVDINPTVLAIFLDSADATLNISGRTVTTSGQSSLNAWTLKGNGTWRGNGTIGCAGNAVLVGTLTVQSPFDIYPAGTVAVMGTSAGGTGELDVDRTLRSKGSLILSSASTNSSRLDVNAGTFINAPGAIFQTSPGGGGSRTLEASFINRGTMDLDTDVLLQNAGQTYINTGTVDVAAGKRLEVDRISQTFEHRAGTMNLPGLFLVDGSSSPPYFKWLGGGVTGTPIMFGGHLVLGGGLPAGTIRCQESVTLHGDVPENVTLEVTADGGTAYLKVDDAMTNRGTIQLSSDTVNSVYLDGAGSFTNTGVIDILPGAGGVRYVRASFANGSSGTVSISQNVSLENVDGRYTNEGTFTIAAGKALVVDADAQMFSQTGGQLNLLGSLEILSSGSISEASRPVFHLAGGTITGNAPLVDYAKVSFDPGVAGVVDVTGTSHLLTSIPAGVTVNFYSQASACYLNVETDIENAGTLRCTSLGTNNTYLGSSGHTITNTGTLEFLPGAGGNRYLRANIVNSASGVVNVNDGTYADQTGQLFENNGDWNVATGQLFRMSGYSTVFTQAGGTLDVEGNLEVQGNGTPSGSFRQTGGTVTANGEILVKQVGTSPSFAVEGGSLTGTVIARDANLSFGTGVVDAEVFCEGNSTLSGDIPATVDLTLRGTSTSGYLTMDDGARNEGNLVMTSTGSANTYLRGAGSFVNSGTLTLEPGTGGTRKIELGFTNETGGRIQFNKSCTLQNDQAMYFNSGTITISSASTLMVNTYGQVFNQEAGILTIEPGGAFQFVGGSTVPSSQPWLVYTGGTTAGTIECNLARLSFGATATCDVRTSSTCNVLTDIPAGVSLICQSEASPAYLNVPADFRNEGTMTFTSSGTSNTYLDGTGPLSNAGTMTFEPGSGGGRNIRIDFTNEAGGSMIFNHDCTLDTSDGSYSNSGTLTIAPGKTLKLNGFSQTFTQDAGSFTIGAGGQLTLVGNASAPTMWPQLTLNGGTITGDVKCEYTDLAFGANGAGEIVLAGTCKLLTDVPAGVTMNCQNTGATGYLLFDGTKINNGIFGFTGNRNFNMGTAGNTLTNNGTLNVGVSGGYEAIFRTDLDNQGRLMVTTLAECRAGATSSGTVTISSGAVLDVPNASFIQTAGTTTLDGGELKVPQDIQVNGGSLAGNGTVTGDVQSAGSIRPAGPGITRGLPLDPGLLTINGNFTQTAAGEIVLEVIGTGPGETDHLEISGDAVLDGALAPRFDGAYTPANGDSFEFMNYNSRTGSLTLDTTTLGDFLLAADYQTNDAFLTVQYPILTVQSSPIDGIDVTVTPNDENGQSNGTTLFTRDYAIGTDVTLTANDPTTHYFTKWQDDKGADLGTAPQLNLALNDHTTVTAVYTEKHTFSGSFSYDGRQTGAALIRLLDEQGATLNEQAGTPNRAAGYTYAFDGLLPGDYSVLAWIDSDGNGEPGTTEAQREYGPRTIPPNQEIHFGITDPNADGDQLPDWWENLHFGGTGMENETGDYDGDTETNGDEYANDTDPADARSVTDPANEYTTFEFLVAKVSTAIQPQRGGEVESFMFRLKAESENSIQVGNLYKPEGATGTNPETLTIEQGNRLAYVSNGHATFGELSSEVPAGIYRIELGLLGSAGGARAQVDHFVRFKVDLAAYTQPDFPAYVHTEDPLHEDINVSVTPLFDFDSAGWSWIEMTEMDTGDLAYTHDKDAGDVPGDTHQVPVEDTLDPDTEYALAVFAYEPTTWLGSITGITFTTRDPDVSISAISPNPQGGATGLGSASVTVANTVPGIENGTINFSVTPQGGIPPYTYEWKLDDNEVGADQATYDYTPGFDTVIHPAMDISQIVTCLISDSQARAVAAVTWQAVSVVDVDRPPAGATLSVTPTAPVTGDDIEVEATTEPVDPDDDTILASQFSWTRPGLGPALVGSQLPQSLTKKGQVWTAHLEVNTDPYGAGTVKREVAQVEVTIGNTPPQSDPKLYEITLITANCLIQLSGEDPDVNQGVDTLSFAVADPPGNGHIAALDITNGQATYDPDPDFTGVDSFTYTVSDGDAVSDPAQVDVYVYAGWVMKLEVTEVDVGTLYIGEETGAANGNDALDLFLRLGPPPIGEPYAAFLPEPGGGSLQRDICDPDDRSEWDLTVISNGIDVEVSWDPADVPLGGLYIWEKDNQGKPDYSTAMDMSKTSAFTVTGADMIKTFTISASCVQEYDLKAGYNLVSLPFEPENANPAATFQTEARRGAGIPVYEGQVYCLAGPLGHVLKPVSELQACMAYWLYLASPQTVTVYGTPGDSDPQLIFNRWVGVGFRNTDGMSQWRATTQIMWTYDAENQQFVKHPTVDPIPLGTGCFFYYGNGSR